MKQVLLLGAMASSLTCSSMALAADATLEEMITLEAIDLGVIRLEPAGKK